MRVSSVQLCLDVWCHHSSLKLSTSESSRVIPLSGTWPTSMTAQTLLVQLPSSLSFPHSTGFSFRQRVLRLLGSTSWLSRSSALAVRTRPTWPLPIAKTSALSTRLKQATTATSLSGVVLTTARQAVGTSSQSKLAASIKSGSLSSRFQEPLLKAPDQMASGDSACSKSAPSFNFPTLSANFMDWLQNPSNLSFLSDHFVNSVVWHP